MIELPDGSGCFTATIMSQDEAMALPLKQRPLNHRISGDIYHAVFEAIGEASTTWKTEMGNEVFNSAAAEKIAVNLCFKIANEAEKWRELSATEVCAGNPAIAEYVANLENRLAASENEKVEYLLPPKNMSNTQDPDGSRLAPTPGSADFPSLRAWWEYNDQFATDYRTPEEKTALEAMWQQYDALRKLGWREAIYCPKDGSVFLAIDAGSTGVFECHYDGEWPKGTWWIHDGGDLWPARPILWKPIPPNAPHEPRGAKNDNRES